MSFFLLLNIKKDILKNVGNQTVDGSHRLPWGKKYYGSQWLPVTVCIFYIVIILCSTEGPYRLATTLRRVNYYYNFFG